MRVKYYANLSTMQRHPAAHIQIHLVYCTNYQTVDFSYLPPLLSFIYLLSFFRALLFFPLFLNKPLVLIRWIAHGCCIILFFLKFYFSIFLLLLLSRLLCSFLFTRLFILRAYAKINSTPKYLPDKYWECCLVADIDMHTIYSNRALRSIQLVKQVYKQNISTMRQIFPFKFETFICVWTNRNERVCLFVRSFGRSMWIVLEWLII